MNKLFKTFLVMVIIISSFNLFAAGDGGDKLKVDLQGVSFILYKDSVEYYKDGKNIVTAKLVQDTKVVVNAVEIVLLKDSDLVFYPSGKLKSGYPAKAVKIDGYDILPKSQFWLYESGKLSQAFISKPIKSGVITFKSAKYDASEKEFLYPTEFYESGKIRGSHLQLDTVININNIAFKFTGNNDRYITFYENGNVKSGFLAEITSVKLAENNIAFKKMANLIFDESGSIRRGEVEPKTSVKIGNDMLKIEDKTYFNTNGTPKHIKLSEDAVITVSNNKHDIPKGSELIFDPDGKLFATRIDKTIEVTYNGKKDSINGMRELYYHFTDFDKKILYSIGKFSVETVFVSKNDVVYFLSEDNYDQITFVNYYPNDNCQSFLKIDENSFSYRDKEYKITPFKWVEFDESGNIK